MYELNINDTSEENTYSKTYDEIYKETCEENTNSETYEENTNSETYEENINKENTNNIIIIIVSICVGMFIIFIGLKHFKII